MTLLVAFGTPGNMSSWGITALQAIVHEAYSNYCFFPIETLPDLKNAWSTRTSDNVIVFAQHPDAALCDFFLRSKTPYIVFTEDVLDSVFYLVQHFRRQDSGITQAVSASIACLSQMKSHAFLISIERQKFGTIQIHHILTYICRKLGIPLTTAAMARCLKLLGADAGRLITRIDQIPTLEESAEKINHFYSAPGVGRDAITGDLREVALKVLEPFNGKILHDQVSSLTWPQESFLLADKGGEAAIGAIELVGKARCLVYGPYFHLPAGQWNARFFLDIDENIYGQIFTIEIFSEDILGKIRILPSGTGSFAAETTFRVERPKLPIEVRLFTDTGSIEGSIAHWHVEMKPIDSEIIGPEDQQFGSDQESDQDSLATERESVNHQN